MSENRPGLDDKLSAEDFKNYYWLKEELLQFCRTHNLKTAGGKIEIANRIAHFLETGEAGNSTLSSEFIAVDPDSTLPRAGVPKSVDELQLDTVIGAGFKCTQIHREFFKRHAGPSFHFSTAIQNYFKENPTKTYQEAIEYWNQEKQNKSSRKTIAPQFEYNRYFRAYFADPQNKDKGRSAAIQAWKRRKSLPGSNEYNPADTY